MVGPFAPAKDVARFVPLGESMQASSSWWRYWHRGWVVFWAVVIFLVSFGAGFGAGWGGKATNAAAPDACSGKALVATEYGSCLSMDNTGVQAVGDVDQCPNACDAQHHTNHKAYGRHALVGRKLHSLSTSVSSCTACSRVASRCRISTESVPCCYSYENIEYHIEYNCTGYETVL